MTPLCRKPHSRLSATANLVEECDKAFLLNETPDVGGKECGCDVGFFKGVEKAILQDAKFGFTVKSFGKRLELLHDNSIGLQDALLLLELSVDHFLGGGQTFIGAILK